MTDIYIASKTKHAARWRALYSASPERIQVVSRWPFFMEYVEETPENAKKFWSDNMADIKRCDCVIFYLEAGEKPCGALLEVGAALALGKTVYVIAPPDHPSRGTWQHMDGVRDADDFSDVFFDWGVDPDTITKDGHTQQGEER